MLLKVNIIRLIQKVSDQSAAAISAKDKIKAQENHASWNGRLKKILRHVVIYVILVFLTLTVYTFRTFYNAFMTSFANVL